MEPSDGEAAGAADTNKNVATNAVACRRMVNLSNGFNHRDTENTERRKQRRGTAFLCLVFSVFSVSLWLVLHSLYASSSLRTLPSRTISIGRLPGAISFFSP